MCEPTTLAISAMALTAVSTGAAAYGNYQAGQYTSKVESQNARMFRQSALDAVSRGSVEASKAAMKGSAVIGTARAVAGGSGVDVQSGSVVDVLSTTRAMSKWDEETIKQNAIREALGYKLQEVNALAKSKAAGNTGVATAATILGGASQMAAIGYDSGLFPKLGKG